MATPPNTSNKIDKIPHGPHALPRELRPRRRPPRPPPRRPAPPRPAPRVAPVAVAPPAPEADVADIVRDAVVPDDSAAAEVVEPAQTPTAPEEAATEIVIEDATLSGAVTTSARTAMLRCGASGYDLPADKYDQWREVEITFDPSGMRLR